MTMGKRDTGRAQAYRAERETFGGHWFEASCWVVRLDPADFLELHRMAVDFLRRELPETSGWDAPRAVIVSRLSSAFRPRRNEVRYASTGLRAHTALHEVAHWATPGDGHGEAWRRAYVALVRDFVGHAVADRLAREFRLQPERRAPSRPRRRFRLQARAEESNTYVDADRAAHRAVVTAWGGYLRSGGNVHHEGRWFRLVVEDRAAADAREGK